MYDSTLIYIISSMPSSPHDHITYAAITPQPKHHYRRRHLPLNVHGEASTSQPKKTVHTNTQSAAKKVSLKSDDINIISFKYSFDALKDQEDMFETDKSAWQKSNNIKSIVNDSDSEIVENVFVEDNGKPMDELVDDARKKVEAPP
ncbi:hypothetical protein Tco_1561523 [Tanacetum coccineum]